MKFTLRKRISLVSAFSRAWFKGRDQGTLLGFTWSFLNPLIMTGRLFFLFQDKVNFEVKGNYFLYILIGTVTWNFFGITVQRGQQVLLERVYLVRNFVFPKELLVFSEIGVYCIQHLCELCIVFGFAAFNQIGFSVHIVMVPFILGVEVIIIAGAALVLSCLSVYARDIQHIWSVFVRMGFFLTPIFYEPSSVSDTFRWVVALNPMTYVIGFLRDAILYHRFPAMGAFFAVVSFSLIFVCAAYRFFKFFEPRVVERI